MDGMTEEELEGLSESERLALAEAGEDDSITGTEPHLPNEEEDDAPIDKEALAKIAAGDDDDDPDNADNPAADPAADPAAVADTDVVQAAEVADDPAEFTPRFVAEVPADAETKFAEFNSKKADLRAKLNDGDIGLDEFTEQLDAIGKEERALERKVWESENAQKQNDNIANQRWQWEQEQFFADKANVAYKDKYLLTALDAAIKDLANDPANASKKGPWFLSEADKMIRERFGMAKPGKQEIDPPPPPPKTQRRNAPPTLANMPSAELPETGGDEFAHLDKLGAVELEAALAKMPQDQQDRYLMG